MPKKLDTDAPLPSFGDEDDDEHASTRAFRMDAAPAPASTDPAVHPTPVASELPRFALSETDLGGDTDTRRLEVQTRPVPLTLPRFPMSSEDVTSPLEAFQTVPSLPTFEGDPSGSGAPAFLGAGSSASMRVATASGAARGAVLAGGATVPLVGGGATAPLVGGSPGGGSFAGVSRFTPPGPPLSLSAPAPASPAAPPGLLARLGAGVLILGTSALVGAAAASWLNARKAARTPPTLVEPGLAAPAPPPSAAPPAAQAAWPASPGPSAAAPRGLLEVPRSPPGGQVWLDGAPVSEPSPPLSVACGRHVVKIVRAGIAPRVEAVDVPCGGHVVLR